MPSFRKINKFFGSLKSAVVIMIYLGVVSAIGTFTEAKYDTEYAQKIVYHSPWMLVGLILLCICLIAVMIDRWPWKKRHLPFLFAHVGIITLLIGALITKVFGVDGNMVFDIGSTMNQVMVNERELSVFTTFDGQSYTRLYNKPVEFLTHPPTKDRPYPIQLGQDKIEILEYWHYTLRKEEIVAATDSRLQPGIRFRIQSDRAKISQTHWLAGESPSEREVNLGPAAFSLQASRPDFRDKNEVVFWLDASRSLQYSVFSLKAKKATASGPVRVGTVFKTGWMDMEVRVLNLYEHAERKVTFERNPVPNDFTQPALKWRFKNREQWLGANAIARIYDDNKMYILTYGNRRIDLGFDINLKDFRVGRYEGTMRAASYESDVEVPGLGKTTISMNNPLRHKGFTFYQASFEQDEQGRPTASVLSVNQDPGRWIKHIGSILIVLGTILLFYFRKTRRVETQKERASR